MKRTGILGCILALVFLCATGCGQQKMEAETELSGISWDSLELSGNLTLSYASL